MSTQRTAKQQASYRKRKREEEEEKRALDCERKQEKRAQIEREEAREKRRGKKGDTGRARTLECVHALFITLE